MGRPQSPLGAAKTSNPIFTNSARAAEIAPLAISEPYSVPGTPRAASVEAPPPLASAPSTTTLASDGGAPSYRSLRIIVPEGPQEDPCLGFGSPLDADGNANSTAVGDDSSEYHSAVDTASACSSYQSAADTASTGSWGRGLPRVSPSSFTYCSSSGPSPAAIARPAASSQRSEDAEPPIPDDLEGGSAFSTGSGPSSPTAPPPTTFTSFLSANAKLVAFYHDRSAMMYDMLGGKAKTDADASRNAATAALGSVATQGSNVAPGGNSPHHAHPLRQRYLEDALTGVEGELEAYNSGLHTLARIFLPETLLLGGPRGVGLAATIYAGKGPKGLWAGQAAAAAADAALRPPVHFCHQAAYEVLPESRYDIDVRFALEVEGIEHHEYFFWPQGPPEWQSRRGGLRAALWRPPAPGTTSGRYKTRPKYLKTIKACLKRCIMASLGAALTLRTAAKERAVDLVVFLFCRIYQLCKKK